MHVIVKRFTGSESARRRWALAFCAALLFSGGCGSLGASLSGANDVTAVVEAANAFLGKLSDDQKSQVVLEFTEQNATAWSNLPCGSACRVGIEFSTLNEEQLTAAKKVIQTATGTGTGTGYDQISQILMADDVLGAAQAGGTGTPPSAGGMPSAGAPSGMPSGDAPDGGMPSGGMSGYSSGTYFLAFLGTPSTDGTWQLHFGGHHLAVNLTYVAGTVAASPFFIGVEPTSWTTDGTTYAPLDNMRDGMLKLTGSLSSDQLAKAKLAQTYTDVLVGPGEDGAFPETKEGIAVSELSDDQKKLVLDAIRPWVSNADDTTAANLMSIYESELSQTYVGYSGGTELTAQGHYVRIDGPSVWVEFVCQNGLVIQGKIHYHTIYRDHTRDYGGEFTFS